jgi:hypothetical protein
VDEKSSFGNGWRFFILQKVREAGCDGKTSDGAVEGGRELGELGERGSPQRYNPVNAAHSPDWRHPSVSSRWHCSLLCNNLTVLVNNWGWQDGGGMV